MRDRKVRHCAIEDCERRWYCRDWCRPHYTRWSKYGDPLGTPPPKPTVTQCAIEDCTKLRYQAHWLCGSHYMRQYRYGDPLADMRPPRRMDITYRTAHERISVDRGKADEHECAECGGQASQWAYRHGSADERVETVRTSDGRSFPAPYSPNPSDYDPLCGACHAWRDRAEADLRQLIAA